MSEAQLEPLVDNSVTATDRFALTLFFAVALHAMIILGITFGINAPAPPRKQLPTLDIVVANHRTAPPDKADYLAQTSQDGSGNTTEQVKPEVATPPPAIALPEQQPETAPTQVVTARNPERKVQQTNTANPETKTPDITATRLIEHSMEMVNLSEQLDANMQAYAERPRQVFVSARTQEFKYANYMTEWVRKVERVGNLNYPDEARRAGISGKLMMDVSLNPDGTVRDIRILRPSGFPVLDEAAIRIVNLASPYLPFPPEIRKDADVLHITRTWEFATNRMTGK
jgi:periplasmic protein TonB